MNNKIQKGTVLIATNPCKMIHSRKNALTVGKEYIVRGITSEGFLIKSKVNDFHLFFFNDYVRFFKIKEDITLKKEAEELVDKFISIQEVGIAGTEEELAEYMHNKAKQCALICVDKEIETLMWLNLLCTFDNPMKKHIEAKITELNEVKQEIEKL